MADQRVDRYLAAVAAELRLPEPWAGEVRAELAAHLADGIEDSVARGMTPDDAAETVIERLGPADSLARRLRGAHQTPRRLAAGIAGGTVAAVGGIIRGTILGYGLALSIAMVVVVCIMLLQRLTGVRVELAGVPSASWADSLWVTAVACGALVAARAATRTVANGSRRDARQLGRWLAVPGVIAIGTWVLFGVSVVLSWPAVIALLAVPVAFAAGALVAIDRAGPRIRRAHVVTVFALCIVLPTTVGLLLVGSATTTTLEAVGSGPYASFDELWRAQGMDVIGRPAPPSMAEVIGDSGERLSDGVATVQVEVRSTAALIGWTDLRLEAWRMTAVGLAVAPGQTAPFASAHLNLIDDHLTGAVRVDGTRDVDIYGLVVVGTSPAGVRHLLWGPNGLQTAFRGTVWDWFTAP